MSSEHLNTEIELPTPPKHEFVHQFVDELSNFNSLIEIH